MQFLFPTFLLLIICISSCSQQEQTPPSTTNQASISKIPKQTESTDKPIAAPKQEAIDIGQLPNYFYPWTNKYDVEKSLAIQIKPPAGFHRTKVTKDSFADWLRHLPLRVPAAPVYLHTGSMKHNQDAHERVVDIDIGTDNLQQCADAVMRLKSEYHFANGEFDKIHFNYTSGHKVSFDDWRKGKKPIVKGNKVSFTPKGTTTDNAYTNFKKYLNQIFTYAGTASLTRELKNIAIKDMLIGDVFIQGGHPGHAVIVIDMVENIKGEKLFMIAQSYMPAQSIHILKNPNEPSLRGWYRIGDWETLTTPEWSFDNKDLKRFN